VRAVSERGRDRACACDGRMERLTEADPRSGFFEAEQFRSVCQHLHDNPVVSEYSVEAFPVPVRA
jgi:hypothetical protein